MSVFTYAELFAGAGGLSMGLETAGWEAVAHAEIEPHARAVLRAHWPDCPMHGDVDAFLGGKRMRRRFRETYTGKVTLLSGGSPCQDLSVAGKRRGMKKGSGTRSSLFFRQVSAWNLCNAPYFLWENVLGAFSSNAGRDFAAVLSALVGAPIAVPADGWESAGVAAGPTGVAAWRVLDCQFFGPPQRRRRVFVLGARAGGVDPAEVLALAEGVRGDSPARGEAREGAAADAGSGADGAGRDADDRTAGDGRDDASGRGRGAAVGFHLTQDPISGEQSPCLGMGTGGVLAVNNDSRAAATSDAAAPLRGGGRAQAAVVSFKPSHYTRDKDGAPNTVAAPLSADADRGDQEQVVVSFAQNQRGELRTSPVAPQLTTGGGKPGEGYSAVLTYDARDNGDGATVNTMAGDHQNRVTDYTAIVLRNREGKPGGGKGPLLSEERSLTLASANDQVVFTQTHEVANTVTAREAKGWNPARDVGNGTTQSGIPRRLMPIETERLQGWPSGWTAYGVAEDGTRYALSDTARYRLCGNGVASPVAAWIGWRLRWALEAHG